MKKKLVCLAVSLMMVIQMLSGCTASAAETGGSGASDKESPQNVSETGGRTAAQNSFSEDLFLVETVYEGTCMELEHYTPPGAPENAICMWSAVTSVNSIVNGGWRLKPAADGHYYLIASANAHGGEALAAASETEIAAAPYTEGDAAQQWDVQPAETDDPFDCKLVNVKYGTELSYQTPADSAKPNGTVICLASEGTVWAIHNLSKSEQTGAAAFLTPGPSEEDGGRAAASSNFASDPFRLETAGGKYQVEHYAPDENEPEESACLWTAYSTSANLGNGGWMLTPVKGGGYCITTSDGTSALTAISETAVSAAQGRSPDRTDPAQQWLLAADETTTDPYDCRIVNVQYQTELVCDKPAGDGAILRLAASGNGDTWAVRNLRQTAALEIFPAYVLPGPSAYVDWGELETVEVDKKTGAVAGESSYDGPQIIKVRVINEGNFLEIYWDRYVDEVQAVNTDNFVLKNGDKEITLEKKGSDYTNTLYFDKNNKEIAATDANCMARLSDDLHMSSIGYEGEIGTIGPEGLTLEVKGAAIKDENGRAAKQASYQGVPKVDYYTQFLTSETGIVIKADDTVAPDTLKAAAAQVDVELSKTETGIAENMAKHGCSLAVYSPRQNAYFIPEHRGGFRADMYDVEGYGGSLYNNCVSSIAERNVLRTKGNADSVLNTAYPDENILIHEFGHCIKSVGIETLEDQTLADELFAAYVNAKETGLWPNTYRISNSDEYFATMCAVWFNVMDEVDNWDDGTRCPLNTREELKKYDPQTYAFFEKILPADTELPAPWNEAAPDIYHDEYTDPDPLAGQIEAAATDFENDLMMVVAPYRGETKLIEKYGPDESRPDENLCLWWVYDQSPADTEQNWAYRVVKTSEGYYQFVATSVEAAITATSATTVSAEGHAPDAADPAQQWKFVENTSTVTQYDGKLVNVKYGSELAFEKPFADGSILVLVPEGNGDNWFVQNITQSAETGKQAYLKPGTAGTAPADSTGRSFADTVGHWASDAVAFVTARSLFSGTSETAFSPDAAMTRGMLLTVLARYDGQDTAGGSSDYEKGLEWAKSKDISDGGQPEQNISRQELAAALYRYAGRPAVSGNLDAFSDCGGIAQEAEQALVWAVENGIIKGVASGVLAPEDSATRAEVAAVLMRFDAVMAA